MLKVFFGIVARLVFAFEIFSVGDTDVIGSFIF